MFILTIDGYKSTQWLCFDSVEEGRQFLSLLPGYQYSCDLETKTIDQEWIDTSAWPQYSEVEFRGNRIPISKFMFDSQNQRVEVYFSEISHAGVRNQGFLDGTTVVDAYSIPNSELKAYITRRENAFLFIRGLLEQQGFEVTRNFQGSEDGEAIMYAKPYDSRKHFLCHLDPCLVALFQEGKQSVAEWVSDLLQE